MQSAFEVHGLTKRYGPIEVVRDVTLAVAPGEVLAVIGENGAGKSSLMSMICGRIPPSAGEIRIDGAAVAFASPQEAQRAGIAIAPQEISLVPELSVVENVMLGRPVRRAGLVDWKATTTEAVRHLAELDPTIDPQARAGDITVAQQQLVQIARATATGARLLIFDEPTAALTERETERLFAFVRAFRARGGLVLYISHRLDEILALADRIAVLRDGRLVAELDPAATDKAEMIRCMAGRAVEELNLRRTIPSLASDEVVLSVRGLTRHGEFEAVDFDLHHGEILGIGGLIGAGRTETMRCLFGDTRREAGEIRLRGRPVDFRSPAEAIAAGLVYLPEERRRDGIFPELGVAENIVLPNLARFLGGLGIRWLEAFSGAERYVHTLPIKARDGHQLIAELSGGNQQKCILARWMMSNCRILMLDEPTRGIDVNAKWEIQKLLRNLAREGASIVYVSSDFQEIIDVCDRVLVMHEGRVRGLVPTDGATPESLLSIAMH